MKKTFWSFFEEKTNCTEDCNALTIKNRTQTGTFAREGLDQDHANNALGEQATLRNGPLTKTASREEKGGLNLYLICRNNVQYYMDDIGQGVVKDTYDFLTDPKGFMLDFIADKNIFTKIIIESVRFSYEFHNLLLKELNSSNILSQLTVIDPQKKCRRKIMFQDYQKIEECLLRDIEDAGTEMIGACMCFLGYSIQKSTPTLKLVQILPGKIGKSFAEATWNKIVDILFSKSKGIVVKRVKRKLPNRFRNKYLYTTVDDMYEIIADELAKTIKETYVNKAKF